MSLDLLGRIPTEAEYAAVRESGDVDDTIVDAMLTSDEFLARMRGYHRALLWGSLAGTPNIVNARHRLSLARVGARDTYYSPAASSLYRREAK